MAEDHFTNEAVAEVSMEMQNLSLKDENKTETQKLPEHEISKPTNVGADEAKASDSVNPETETQPVKGRVFVGGISWRTTDRELRVSKLIHVFFEDFKISSWKIVNIASAKVNSFMLNG